MRNNDEKFFANFAHYELPGAFNEDGELNLLNGSGVAPRLIEVTGGVLRVLKINGDEETTRSYSDWGSFWGSVEKIIEEGTTATEIQVFW